MMFSGIEGRFELLWSEHFDQTIDANSWNFDHGDGTAAGIPGWGNNEREFYIDESFIADNGLTITALRQEPNSPIQTYYGPAEWTSGKIHTSGKISFQYGYFEFLAQVPAGKGTWPAIWMLGDAIATTPWPACGEIDIFEGSGNESRTVRGTLHGPGYSADQGVTAAIEHSEDLHAAMHAYGLLWLPDRIEWFFDGLKYSSISRDDERLQGKAWPFNAPHYLILNLAMGGWFAGEIDPALADAKFHIKSIDAYSVNGVGTVIQHG